MSILRVHNATRRVTQFGSGEDPPKRAKFVAATSLFLWFAIIVLGRYLPLTQESLK